MQLPVLDRLILGAQKPSRYAGGELNAVHKRLDEVALRWGLAFPDPHAVGMSNVGFSSLYHALNERRGVACQRFFMPWPDMESALRAERLPLFSIESRAPAAAFDVLGFTLQFELCYTTVLAMLELGGVPLFTRDRGRHDPLVLGGGPCAYNPEPVADFFDAFVIGEGEEAIHQISDVVMEWKRSGGSRSDLLWHLAEIPGVYVPSLFQPRYGADRTIAAIEPLKPGYETVVRRVIPDLNLVPQAEKPIVPFMQTVHDRLPLEIQRGCTRGCRFCQAGMLTRPTRERSKETILEIARQLARNTGFEEISLLSLSAGDYSDARGLVKTMMDEFRDSNVSVSMPALRVDSFTVDIAKELAQVRRTGFTFAPEAGSQRLRDVINKGVTNENLLKAVEGAFSEGWHTVKLYYMMGLPTETFEDLQEMADVVKRVAAAGYRHHGPKASVHVSVSSFVPKPHTPFQWVAQDSMEMYAEKVRFLQQNIRGRGLRLSWNEPNESLIEGALARGDRRLADVIERAWRLGCRFDAWGDHFKFELWQQAFEDCG